MNNNQPQPWYTDKKFSFYWETYQKGLNWYRAHEVSYWKSKALALEYENQCLHTLLQTTCSNLDGVHSEERKAFSARFPVSNTPVAKPETFREEAAEEQPETEEFEMEITDEMMEFFAQSMKHKKEQQSLQELEDNVEYINADAVTYEKKFADIYGSQLPSDSIETNGKDESYRNMYGEDAPKIQAMETALDLTFQAHCSRKQPSLWPNIPLKL